MSNGNSFNLLPTDEALWDSRLYQALLMPLQSKRISVHDKSKRISVQLHKPVCVSFEKMGNADLFKHHTYICKQVLHFDPCKKMWCE